MEKSKKNLFDFSAVNIGDRTTRIYQGYAWDAEIVRITDGYIDCGMTIDTYRTLRFDRKTGISGQGKSFGFIINMPIEKWEEGLIFSLCDEELTSCIDLYDFLKNFSEVQK